MAAAVGLDVCQRGALNLLENFLFVKTVSTSLPWHPAVNDRWPFLFDKV